MAHTDELELMNAALKEGARMGANVPWVKYDRANPETWPEHGMRYVTIGKNGHARVLGFDFAFDDSSWPEWTVLHNGYEAKDPVYWCPYPCASDYE